MASSLAETNLKLNIPKIVDQIIIKFTEKIKSIIHPYKKCLILKLLNLKYLKKISSLLLIKNIQKAFM